MEGKIVIKAFMVDDRQGFNVEGDLRDVSLMDKFMTMKTLMSSLNLSGSEMWMFFNLNACGMFDDCVKGPLHSVEEENNES